MHFVHLVTLLNKVKEKLFVSSTRLFILFPSPLTLLFWTAYHLSAFFCLFHSAKCKHEAQMARRPSLFYLFLPLTTHIYASKQLDQKNETLYLHFVFNVFTSRKPPCRENKDAPLFLIQFVLDLRLWGHDYTVYPPIHDMYGSARWLSKARRQTNFHTNESNHWIRIGPFKKPKMSPVTSQSGR